MRDNLTRCMKRREVKLKSGAMFSSLPRCKYFDAMQFLHSIVVDQPVMGRVVNSQLTDPKLVHQSVPISTLKVDGELMSKALNAENVAILTPEGNLTSPTLNSTSSNKRKSTGDHDYHSYSVEETLKEDDEATSFCISLIPQMKALPLKKLRYAKCKINELLFDLEYGTLNEI